MFRSRHTASPDTVAAGDPLAPSPEFLAARERWGGYVAKRHELVGKIEAMNLALEVARFPKDIGRAPVAVRERAGPYMNRAMRRRSRLEEDVDDVETELAALPHEAEQVAWSSAQRRESDRIGALLRERHREAVRAMARALEDLSAAMAQELEVHAELRRRAPLPESPNVPDLSAELLVLGLVSDPKSPAAAWARRVRNSRVLLEA